MTGWIGTLPLWASAALFLGAAVVVWIAGTRLSRLADAIARRTGIGQATIGVLLLGGVTSLPEIAVAGSAALAGNGPLAVNNLLGGFTMQVAILALADAIFRRGALTRAVPDPVVLLQGSMGVVLMAMVVAAVAVGDVAVLGAGLWSWAIFAVFLVALRLLSQAEGGLDWEVVGEPPSEDLPDVEAPNYGTTTLILHTVGVAAAIFAAGWLLASTAETLAEGTGLGQSFFGAVFVAVATSLPEVSTVIAAMRLKRYVMAVSDILGTNLFDIALILLVDLAYVGPAVLGEMDRFSILAGVLGILVTAIYMVGLIERRDPAVAGVGFDSIAVAVVYLSGIALLFTLR
ncbi:sodium:calcium antiporter [Silicimonas algicola]|uniref:Cation:H+ antiporter n=1 Tax=Silicimonas algicola TaxID=1826607 RepID=A0A316G4K2_9RHOB|nr:sodium:calcium antiporter [Silicimonas algicola]AZQ66975.1 sodium:calcium antiporter [Silicimonas algicola]PWK55512.1 cation:H+ antiporter [Silicimonas algicola]